MQESSATGGYTLGFAQASQVRGSLSQEGHRRGVSVCEGAFEIGEIGTGVQELVNVCAGNPPVWRWLCLEHTLQHSAIVDFRKERATVPQKAIDHCGIVGPSTASPQDLDDQCIAANPVPELGVASNDDDTDGKGDSLAGQVARKPFPIPAFESLGEGITERVCQAYAGSEYPCCFAVRSHRPLSTVYVGKRSSDEARSTQRWAASGKVREKVPHDFSHFAHEARAYACIECRVITAGHRSRFMRTGCAADETQQRKVIDVRELLAADMQVLGQADCKQAGAQGVLHRLARTQVRG